MREKTRTISVRGQNCDPLNENNDFTLGVGSQTGPLWLAEHWSLDLLFESVGDLRVQVS
jgi:hypothetical protein